MPVPVVCAVNGAGANLALACDLIIAATAALAAIKHGIRSAWKLDLERDLQRERGRSADYAEGVAAFLDKRVPRFTGA